MLKFFSFSFPATLVRVLLAFFLVSGGWSAVAQAPSWQSTQAVTMATATTGTNSAVTATTVDAMGNVYLVGHFSNTVVLGSTTLTSVGLNDVFIAKFNPSTNQFVWAQRAGGTDYDVATAIAVSGGSVYIAGGFRGLSAAFGATVLTNTNTVNTNTSDVFIAKLSDAGNTSSFEWAQGAGGVDSDGANALVVAGNSIYVAGAFSGPAGTSVNFDNISLTCAGAADIFVAKLTDTGSTSRFIWAQRAGGTEADQPTALTVSGNSLYVAGLFESSTADFGTVTLTGAGSADVFVTKLTDAGSTGSFAWAQRAGGNSYDGARALAVNGNSVYMAGYFYSATVGFGTSTLNSAGSVDIFVAKLTDAGSTGNFVWAQRAGGTSGDVATSIAVSANSVYLAGFFESPTADFGTTTLTATGSADVFVTKLTDAGSTASFVWAQRAGGSGIDQASTLTLSGTSVYVAGNSDSPTAGFGSITLTNPYPGSNFAFLASLTDPTLTATTPAAGATFSLYPNPAHRSATLRLPASTTPAPLTLCDAQGRTVRRYATPATPETTLDLHGLPAGLYLLRGSNFTQRLAVE